MSTISFIRLFFVHFVSLFKECACVVLVMIIYYSVVFVRVAKLSLFHYILVFVRAKTAHTITGKDSETRRSDKGFQKQKAENNGASEG